MIMIVPLMEDMAESKYEKCGTVKMFNG
jgi:hypothetical protein